MIAISGGTGLIGSALGNLLQERREAFKLGSRNLPKGHAPEVPWQKTDLADGYGLGSFLSDTRQVVHLARNFRPLVDVGGSWRLSYRAKQKDIAHLIYLGAADGKIPGPWQNPHLKEIAHILRNSGIPISLIYSAPSYQWIERYLNNKRVLTEGNIPLQPVALGQILTVLDESLSNGPLKKIEKLQGREKLNLKDLYKIFRHYKARLNSDKVVIHAESWEDYLAQKSR